MISQRDKNSEERKGGVAFISFYFLFFNLPPVALLTLEGRAVNKPLRAVYIQSDISAEGADSSFSLLGVTGKK